MRILWATREDRYNPNRNTYHRLYWRAQEVHGHECDLLGRNDCLYPWRLYIKIKQYKPDVLFIGNFVTFWAVWLRILRLTRLPLINCWNETLREASPWADLPQWQFSLIIPLLRKIEIFDAIHSDGSITPVLQNAALGREYGAKNIYYLLNAHAPNPKTESSVKLEGENFKVAYLGDQRGWNRKNIGKTFEAVAGEECTLYMIDDIHEPTKQRAPKNVVFTGPVPADEVHAVLLQADCLINGTDQDSDLKNGEYILAGKPLLAYRGRGMHEHVYTHLHNAYIAENMKEGLRTLMADKNLRDRLGANIQKLPVSTEP